MPGIDPNVITHHLNVCPSPKPVQQKKRVFAPERDNAIKDEVQKGSMVKWVTWCPMGVQDDGENPYRGDPF